MPSLDDDDLVSAYDDLPLWSAPFGLALLDAVRLGGVRRALDVGCGTGFPMVELAERLGAPVIGLDPWRRALGRAHAKLRVRGARGALVCARGEDMPFSDGQFDLVVSNVGVSNADDPAKALRECGRVTRAAGQLAMAVNLPSTMQGFYDAYAEALVSLGRSGDVPKIAAHIAARRQPVERWRAWIEEAGFGEVVQRDHTFTLRYARAAALLGHWFIRLGFLDGWVGIVGELDAPAVLARLGEILDERAVGDAVALDVPFVCLTATKRS